MSDKIREALAGVLAIVDESRGVDGYHLNGDIAEWGEFPEVEAARAALVAKPVMPTEAELIAIAEQLGSVAELCRTEDHPDTIWRIRYEVEELVREVLKTYAVAPVAQEPDTVKAPRDLLDSAARSCANGWVDHHTARELRALLSKE